MNGVDAEFTSAALSARRLRRAEPTVLPFGLSWADLAPAIDAPAPGWAAHAQALHCYERPGRWQGQHSSMILTVRYPGRDGRQAERTVFVKRAIGARHKEATHFAFLRSVGIPTPALLAVVDRDDQELIVTEFLPRIGIDHGDPQEVAELLELLADLNAVPTKPGELEPGPGRPEAVMDRLRREGLKCLAADSRLGVDPQRWWAALARAGSSVAAMPRALTHGEFGFQQCGWAERPGGDSLVLFDLATLARGPRFADLGFILPICARAGGTDEEQLMAMYLDLLARRRVRVPTVREGMAELRTHRIWDSFTTVTHQDHGPGSDELLEGAQRLRDDMIHVGLL